MHSYQLVRAACVLVFFFLFASCTGFSIDVGDAFVACIVMTGRVSLGMYVRVGLSACFEKAVYMVRLMCATNVSFVRWSCVLAATAHDIAVPAA